MSENTDYLIDALAAQVRESVHQQGSVILEMLGITIPLPSLPSWDEYQRLHQRLYGNDRRILLLKRTFTPRRYKRLWKRYIEVQLNLQQEFLDAALNESAEVGIDE